MEVKISQATEMIVDAIKAKLTPFLKGSPGTGKSQVIHQIADMFNLKLIDLRLSQCDPTDLAGFPTVVNGRATYAAMAHFPIEGDPLPAGYSGWLLFLDELNSAPQAIQAAAYKVILDRMVGDHRLHPHCAVVGAGNLDDDGAITHEMSTALESRMIHLQLQVDASEWDEWATTKGDIHHHITSFIKFKPDLLYTFKPDHTDCTYACPRTWEFASRLLKVADGHKTLLPLLAGTLSEGVAHEFSVFRKVYSRLPVLEDIIDNPNSIRVPDEPSILFALTGSIAQKMDEKNADPLMEYISRLPSEFQVVCLREAFRRNKGIAKLPSFQKWQGKLAKAVF